MKNKLKPYFRAALKNDVLELSVYEEIGADWFGQGVTANEFKQQLDATRAYSTIAVRINSPGGDAFEGIAIANLLRAQGKPVAVYIDGLAASAASIVAMAGDSITMASNAMMMIHNAWRLCAGDANDMRKTADTLEKVSASIAQTYVDRTGKSPDEVKALMDAETWMSAADCLKDGFATAIAGDDADAMAFASRFKSLAKLKNVPEQLKPQAEVTGENDNGCACDCANCVANDCQNCTMTDCTDENCEDCPMQMGASNSTETAQAGAEQIETESNLSLYEARLKLLRVA